VLYDTRAEVNLAAWEHYFHFPPGTDFYIDGPWGYNGRGKVVENTETGLSLRIDLPAWGPAPEFRALLTVEYRKEGPGNLVVLERDGTAPLRDENASVRSNDNRRERSIASSAVTCSVRYESRDEINFDVHFNGTSYHFDLMLD
jgi:hypothetical protein